MDVARRFKDILDLPFERSEHGYDVICMDALEAVLPAVPMPVLKQVFCDHGRKAEFQAQFGELELDTVDWQLRRLPAGELARAEPYEEFRHWMRTTAEFPQYFPKLAWQCVSLEKDIQEYWAATNTWQTPPVLIDGTLINSSARWRLMEGLTRIGLLGGLIKYDILSADSMHDAWCGVPRAR